MQPNPFGPTQPQQQAQPTANPFGPAQPQAQSTAQFPQQQFPQQQFPQQQFGGQQSDPFGAPAPQGDRPRLRDLALVGATVAELRPANRLLLITPLKFERDRPSGFKDSNGNVILQDRMTCDVVVLDGPPVNYGGRPEARSGATPHTKVHEVPWVIEALYISQRGLVSQLREAYANRISGRGPGMVLGRIHAGQQTDANREAPWLLSVPTEQDQQIARAWLAQHPVDPFAGARAA